MYTPGLHPSVQLFFLYKRVRLGLQSPFHTKETRELSNQLHRSENLWDPKMDLWIYRCTELYINYQLLIFVLK